MTQKVRMLSFMMKIQPEFIALYGENLEKIHLFDGMLELLLACHKKGYRIAVLSSNAVENIRAFFGRHSLPFDLEIVSSNGLFGKHKTIKEFAKEHGVTVSDLLYIGDEIRDVKACNRCGADIAFVRWGLDGGAGGARSAVRGGHAESAGRAFALKRRSGKKVLSIQPSAKLLPAVLDRRFLKRAFVTAGGHIPLE